ncbi:hypothetical protein HN51_007412 [Arachis hypogaea]
MIWMVNPIRQPRLSALSNSASATPHPHLVTLSSSLASPSQSSVHHSQSLGLSPRCSLGLSPCPCIRFVETSEAASAPSGDGGGRLLINQVNSSF